MQSLEGTCEEGEVTACLCNNSADCNNCKSYKMVCTHSRTFKKSKRSSLPLNLPQDSAVPTMDVCTATNKPQFCIHTKLLELYLEECAKDPNQQNTGLKQNTNLLEKLVAKERLNTIILNLYAGYKGYSIVLPPAPNNDSCGDGTESNNAERSNSFNSTASTAETEDSVMRSFDDEELLRYLDLEEIPAVLVDILEPYHSFLFYSGCLIVQVRDYRRTFPTVKCDIHHVLLKPSLQSVMADCNAAAAMVSDDWNAEDRTELESKILLVNHPRLCLDVPRTAARRRGSCHAAVLQHNRHTLNTHPLRRASRRFSLTTVNRKKKLASHSYRPGLELYEYLTRMRARPEGLNLNRVSRGGRGVVVAETDVRPVPVPNLEPQYLPPPTGGVYVDKFKAYARPPYINDCRPQLVEEYVLKTDTHAKDTDNRRPYNLKLSILQRPSCGEYLGELHLDRENENGQCNGVACRFSLGTQVHTNRYIKQFAQIFTEGGRNSFIPGRLHFESNEANLAQSNSAPNISEPVQQQQPQQTANTTAPLLAHLKYLKDASGHDVNAEVARNNLALARKLLPSVHQIQAEKQQQQPQQLKVQSSGNHAEIINLLNSSPASNINNDASTAVVNAINNSTLLQQSINHKIVGRKIAVTNVVPPNARVLNATNVIAMNNNRTVSVSDLAQQHYATMLNKRQIRGDGGKKALSALLVGTPAADRTDIANTITNSLVSEKLANASQNVQSTSGVTTASFLPNAKYVEPGAPSTSSPGTINVQSLNFAQLQGMQNVQLQLASFSQPISFSFSSAGSIPGQPTSLLVSVPVASTTSTTSTTGQCMNNNNSIGTSQTVVLANAGGSNLAQLVSAGGVKRPAGVLNQGATPFQLVATQLGHRPTRTQQQQGRRGPITIKRATTAPQTNLNNVQQQKQFQQQQLLNNATWQAAGSPPDERATMPNNRIRNATKSSMATESVAEPSSEVTSEMSTESEALLNPIL